MKDEALTTAPALTPAEAAVNYVLQRIRVDADLRYHMLYTEAFARLCAAEAVRVGKTVEEIKALCSEPAKHCKNDVPKLVKLRAAVLRAIDTYRENCRNSKTELLVNRMIEELEEAI